MQLSMYRFTLIHLAQLCEYRLAQSATADYQFGFMISFSDASHMESRFNVYVGSESHTDAHHGQNLRLFMK